MKSQSKFTLIVAVLVVAVSAGGLIPKSAYAAPGDLFVSVNLGGTFPPQPGGSAVFQYSPAGPPPSIVASNLNAPRGVAFDNAGNLFVVVNMTVDSSGNLVPVQGTIFKILPGGTMTAFATNFPSNAMLTALVIDSEGNLFVDGQDVTDPNFASTIYKVLALDGTVSLFGSISGQCLGLAFDSAGNLYAGDNVFQKIYKFTPAGALYQPTPTGTPGVFAGPAVFASNEGPAGLAFDRFGNLFVSTEYITGPVVGNDAILKFTPDGTEISPPFATGLTLPRGLAFDGAGNLFVGELGVGSPGDILEFTPDGTEISPPFASTGSSHHSPHGAEFLAFQPGSNTTTSAGSNVITNAGTVGFATIALTFPQVTSAGTTTVTPVNPSAAGYTLPGSSFGFDITTTATYPTPVPTPPGIVIAFQVARPLDVSQLTVLHNEGGSLVNVTCPSPRPGPTPDTTTNTIYASVTSLSPFVVAKLPFTAQVQPPINADGTSGFTVKRGVVPVKFTLTQDGAPTCTLPPATIALSRTAGANVGSVNESTYVMPADSGSNFRIDSCQYIYNLNSGGLGAGTYRVDIKISGVPVGSAAFQVK